MKRIRIIAGPNGSGKSTLVKQFTEGKPWLLNKQLHIDPDKLNCTNIIDFGKFGIKTNISEFKDHLLKSTLFPKSNINIEDIKFGDNCLINNLNNPYVGSLVADFIREKLIESDISLFSFETVFSHKSKLEFMERSKQKGWELYLYFVGTSKVSINQDRVKERAEKGEHTVPDQKIIDRYIKSNNFLYDASKLCRRVYLFDNSEDSAVLLAEKDIDGTILIKNEDRLPQWINTYFFAKFES